MRCIEFMKTATIPSVRIEPELRAEIESLLGEGETVSELVEASVRAAVLRLRHRAEFIASGVRSLERARRTGDCAEADAVVEVLQRKLDAARAQAGDEAVSFGFASRARPRPTRKDSSISFSSGSPRAPAAIWD